MRYCRCHRAALARTREAEGLRADPDGARASQALGVATDDAAAKAGVWNTLIPAAGPTATIIGS
jgi:hypothetical protein